jgi:hypothetical protein
MVRHARLDPDFGADLRFAGPVLELVVPKMTAKRTKSLIGSLIVAMGPLRPTNEWQR